ncbi:hypothetical protein COV11_00005, partial [Candidatus Woesearchaeota archaeon CG10_big_fil_rev_8_21_14_0_10_30_7]
QIQQLSTPSNSGINSTGINWGVQRSMEPIAYIQPTQSEIDQVLEAIHRIESLPADQQKQLIEATREIRYFFDGQVRARFGGTFHYNAIRCLNNPLITEVNLNTDGVQLAGEEFFGLNRFMTAFPDIADIHWWALYQNGSWRLDDWNPEGEHLDTGMNGWGKLVGSVMKVNGKVLDPREMIAFYRTIKLRNERGLQTKTSLDGMQGALRSIKSGEMPVDELLEELSDFGLLNDTGTEITYVGESSITPITAKQRRARQETEQDPNVRGIIHPLIFN